VSAACRLTDEVSIISSIIQATPIVVFTVGVVRYFKKLSTSFLVGSEDEAPARLTVNAPTALA
jgi:hypothetical protein